MHRASGPVSPSRDVARTDPPQSHDRPVRMCERAVAGAMTRVEWSVAGGGVEVGRAESGSRRRQEDVMQNENDCGISKWRMRAQAVRAAIGLVVATMPPVSS
jgi:hypothetical protein